MGINDNKRRFKEALIKPARAIRAGFFSHNEAGFCRNNWFISRKPNEIVAKRNREAPQAIYSEVP